MEIHFWGFVGWLRSPNVVDGTSDKNPFPQPGATTTSIQVSAPSRLILTNSKCNNLNWLPTLSQFVLWLREGLSHSFEFCQILSKCNKLYHILKQATSKGKSQISKDCQLSHTLTTTQKVKGNTHIFLFLLFFGSAAVSNLHTRNFLFFPTSWLCVVDCWTLYPTNYFVTTFVFCSQLAGCLSWYESLLATWRKYFWNSIKHLS